MPRRRRTGADSAAIAVPKRLLSCTVARADSDKRREPVVQPRVLLLAPRAGRTCCVPFIPSAVALELTHASAGLIFGAAALGRDPDGRADGPGDRGGRRQVGARHRRAAQRHLRQRARADHRPLRAQRRPARGRQGVDHRLDPRQHPAGHGRRDARGRPRRRPRGPELRPHCGERPVADAVARGRRPGDACRLRAGRGPGPPGDRPGAGRLRLHGRAPVAGGGDRADRDLRGRAAVQPAHPPQALQPAQRGRRGARRHLGLVDPRLGHRARGRRASRSA